MVWWDRINDCDFDIWLMKKPAHGGKRKGAGRKRKEPTKPMRIPVSKIEAVKKLIKS